MTSTPVEQSSSGPLVARTVPIDLDDHTLASLLPRTDPLAWLRRGEGVVGWGQVASIRTRGPNRFGEADRWWRSVTSSAVARNEVSEPGTGLIAFGSFGFADDPGDSILRVPEVVVGRRGDTAWLTTITRGALSRGQTVEPTTPPAPPVGLRFSDGALDGQQWRATVGEAVQRIQRGELHKVVLARDLLATTDEPIDVRWPLQRLAEAYPMCWTFHVDGLIGATPEMLVRRERGLVTSRVLAGTIRRTGDDEHDLALAGTLTHSSKDLGEHEYAVASVADSLERFCSSMNVPDAPFVLHLPNVMHLATDVTGVVSRSSGPTSLALAAALHPSAAVGGTPTDSAMDLIDEIEQMPRGRYAGPVGWMDATGDGEWGLALRSAEIDGSTVRLFAGCGIVADSDPEAELAESVAKFVPMRDALES